VKKKFFHSIGFKIIFFYILLSLINVSFVIFIIFENQVELISKNSKIETELQFSNLISSLKKFSSEMNKGTLFGFDKNQKSLDNFLKMINPHAKNYLIISEKNRVLHKSDAGLQPPLTMPEDILRSITVKNFSGKEYYLRIDEKGKKIYCYIPLSDFQLGNIYLIAVKDISSLNSSLKNLYRQAIYIILVVLLFHAMFALVLFRYIINPIKLLNQGVKRVRNLDFSTHILLPDRNDEFGTLAESYNNMADTISENMKMLKDDITSSKKIQKKMEKLTVKDEITGLLNRIYMIERIQEQVRKTYKNKNDSALLIIDLDDFKDINNIYGNKSGDIILLEVSKIITRNCSETDLISRFSADKFAVLSDNSSLKYVEKLSKKIKSDIEKNTVITPDGKFSVTASIGVSFCRSIKKTGSADDLIKSAEHALKQAKLKGKNRIEIIS
jgi:diguanylate cyclase (GGDEF)-like protein